MSRSLMFPEQLECVNSNKGDEFFFFLDVDIDLFTSPLIGPRP